ncbi:MAG TPA: GrpB family protein [Actinoplanes sp.]|nr:GrpB family protein [Actinoplanes sp.]
MPFADESTPVKVVDYRPSWPAEFAALEARLRTAAGDSPIDHVGSTSVPGLPAKDCIDVQIRVLWLDRRALVTFGFRLRPERWNREEVSSGVRCQKMVFAPPAGERACNIHLRLAGGPNARYALLFRDYLRAEPATRDAWGAFKRRLAASVPDLADYGQIKAPATEILMGAAERWAAATGWTPESG